VRLNAPKGVVPQDFTPLIKGKIRWTGANWYET